VFARRFFATSQFKRSASPNGPKITSGGALSPRGDWRVPSDAGAAPWLRDVARLRAQLADEGGRRSPASPPRGRR
jgi:NAD+ synthase (glutamine-hydrolysing)